MRNNLYLFSVVTFMLCSAGVGFGLVQLTFGECSLFDLYGLIIDTLLSVILMGVLNLVNSDTNEVGESTK